MIFNNFLPKRYAQDIHREVNTFQFPWHYSNRTIEDLSTPKCVTLENHRDTEFFQHVAINESGQSNWYPLFNPMLYFFEKETGYEIKSLTRIVLNLMTRTTIPVLGIPHIDMTGGNPEKLKTLLYYVNDADGPTSLYNERYTGKKLDKLTLLDEIHPEANKAVLFDSDRYHCSCTPVESKRIVINLIFEIK